MDDLISRQGVLKDLEEYIVNAENAISEHPDDIRNYNSGLLTAIQVVTDTPPIQSERKKGKWVNDRGLYKCSSCGELWLHWWASCVSIEQTCKELRYCPYCGADMREENDDDN